jgi:hypothetical protein
MEAVFQRRSPLRDAARIPCVYRSQRINLRRNNLACRHQISDDPLIHIQVALVLTKIANVMAFRQNAPHLWSDSKCLRQELKDKIAIGAAIPTSTQRRQAQRVGGVVGQVEAALY